MSRADHLLFHALERKGGFLTSGGVEGIRGLA